MISFKEKINMSLIKNNIKIEKNPFDLLEKWYKKAKKNEGKTSNLQESIKNIAKAKRVFLNGKRIK